MNASEPLEYGAEFSTRQVRAGRRAAVWCTVAAALALVEGLMRGWFVGRMALRGPDLHPGEGKFYALALSIGVACVLVLLGFAGVGFRTARALRRGQAAGAGWFALAMLAEVILGFVVVIFVWVTGLRWAELSRMPLVAADLAVTTSAAVATLGAIVMALVRRMADLPRRDRMEQ